MYAVHSIKQKSGISSNFVLCIYDRVLVGMLKLCNSYAAGAHECCRCEGACNSAYARVPDANRCDKIVASEPRPSMSARA